MLIDESITCSEVVINLHLVVTIPGGDKLVHQESIYVLSRVLKIQFACVTDIKGSYMVQLP